MPAGYSRTGSITTNSTTDSTTSFIAIADSAANCVTYAYAYSNN